MRIEDSEAEEDEDEEEEDEEEEEEEEEEGGNRANSLLGGNKIFMSHLPFYGGVT